MSLKTIRFHKTAGVMVASLVALTACDTFEGIPSITELGSKVDPVPGTTPKQSNNRPKPDENGVITYPNYQVIVARRGDSMSSLASRVGISADEFSRFNGLSAGYRPRVGELFALPKSAQSVRRITEEPARPSNDPLTIAEETLGDVPNQPAVIPSGPEPERHIVQSGETAYTIARKYGVSVTALASWNGLDKDLNLRTGQQLLIPLEKEVQVAAATPPSNTGNATGTTPRARPAGVAVAVPGAGSVTPLPPSSTKPTPKPEPKVEIPKPAKPAPAPKPAASSQLLKPVSGSVLRDFSSKPGGNEGIDFKADRGATVKSADAGTIALTSNSVDGSSIVLVRHANNLYTVYSNVTDVTVKKGQKVSRGQNIGKVGDGKPPYLHFEVRKGTEAVNPAPYLN